MQTPSMLEALSNSVKFCKRRVRNDWDVFTEGQVSNRDLRKGPCLHIKRPGAKPLAEDEKRLFRLPQLQFFCPSGISFSLAGRNSLKIADQFLQIHAHRRVRDTQLFFTASVFQ